MSNSPVQATQCRMCGGGKLDVILDLGVQTLTGIFPHDLAAKLTAGPLKLVKCMAVDGCGLVQLLHSYDLGEMYGENYGYRSGLNASMVRHLHAKVQRIRSRATLAHGDLVLDIGSNDGTTLGAYPVDGLTLVGMDPTGAKFRSYYPKHVELIADFFSSAAFSARFPGRKAKVVTSFSMFYDLEDSLGFMRQVHRVLADDGMWVFEQSYMPLMLTTNSFDTVCHEHLEFYGLAQIVWAAKRVGFDVTDVEFNDVNGGSFSIEVRKTPAGREQWVAESVQLGLAKEAAAGLDGPGPFAAFAARTAGARRSIIDFLTWAKRTGRRVVGLGASTKGNVLLQYCGVTADLLSVIGETNPDKYDAFTPGSGIPIRPEDEVLASNPDFCLVLPWHFREFFVGNPKFAGQTLVFPLPQLEVVRV